MIYALQKFPASFSVSFKIHVCRLYIADKGFQMHLNLVKANARNVAIENFEDLTDYMDGIT